MTAVASDTELLLDTVITSSGASSSSDSAATLGSEGPSIGRARFRIKEQPERSKRRPEIRPETRLAMRSLWQQCQQYCCDIHDSATADSVEDCLRAMVHLSDSLSLLSDLAEHRELSWNSILASIKAVVRIALYSPTPGLISPEQSGTLRDVITNHLSSRTQDERDEKDALSALMTCGLNPFAVFSEHNSAE